MTSTEAEEAGEAFALFLGALSSTETSFWFRILDQENDASSDDNQERLRTKHGEEKGREKCKQLQLLEHMWFTVSKLIQTMDGVLL